MPGKPSDAAIFTYSLPATYEDLPGEYTIAINGSSGKLKTNFNKTAPSETGSILLGDDLILYNFLPFEKIRLVVYQENSIDRATREVNFVGWQNYQVDTTGNLRIHLDLDI